MYYVVHPDGSRYGPADLPTLQAWATEGRLIQATTVIDAATGQQMIAGRIPGLVWGHNPAAQHSQPTVMPGQISQTPYGSGAPGQMTQTPYGTSNNPHQIPRYGGYSTAGQRSSLGMVSLVCGISSVLCLCICAPLGIISAVAGMIAASSAKAKGEQSTGWGVVLNVAGLLLNIAVMALLGVLKPRIGGL